MTNVTLCNLDSEVTGRQSPHVAVSHIEFLLQVRDTQEKGQAMATREQYALEEGRRPTFTNTAAIMTEPNGWYRHRGHRRRPGVVRGRRPRTSDGRKHVVISYNANVSVAAKLRPFSDYVTAYVAGHITDNELSELADFYGKLGYKVAPGR